MIKKDEKCLNIIENQQNLEEVKQFNYSHSKTKNDIYTKPIKDRIVITKTDLHKHKKLITGRLNALLKKNY